MKLKKLIVLASAFIVALVVGCADYVDSPALPDLPGGNRAPEVGSKKIRINYNGSGSKYRLWAWDGLDTESNNAKKVGGKDADWPNGIPFEYTNGDFVCVDLDIAENATKLSMQVVDESGTKYVDSTEFNFPNDFGEIYLFAGDTTAYVKPSKQDSSKPIGIYAATFTNKTTLNISGYYGLNNGDAIKLKDWAEDTKTKFSIEDRNEKTVGGTITANDSKLTLSTEMSTDEYSKNAPYKLVIKTDEKSAKVAISIENSLVDEWFGENAVKDLEDDKQTLGYKGNKFTTWAPLANSVNLLLYKEVALLPEKSNAKGTVSKSIPMKQEPNGFFVATVEDASSYKYYQYEIKNPNATYVVADIWGYAASPDSIASQIVDIESGYGYEVYSNPFDNNTQRKYSDAVIYEMHIRDWSRVVNENSTGTFSEMADDKIINHLRDLGVTHVQILPMFDYAQTNADKYYNWGYNPYHYNVPEGRYVKDMGDGTDAVLQMRGMIKKLHEAGIAVIMDVVYNHTNGTGTGSLYDMTVPGYFYRDTDFSGCGNAISTDRAMVKQYVIESLKHWMRDYGINGFRFDLMGIHEQEFMKDVYRALCEIDPNVMVYGEPWTGNGDYPKDGCKGAVDVTNAKGSNGVGAFDDDFRDAIKGAEFGGFKIGQVQETFNDDGIEKGLLGEQGANSRNGTGKAVLSLHYVECHDNYTLFDKLAYSAMIKDGVQGILGGDAIVSKFPWDFTKNESLLTDEQIGEIKKQNKLAAAYVLLAQGTPFINGGQEFMRTKKGNPDSYSADTKGGVKWTNESGAYNIDDCNKIDLNLKTADVNGDVYNTYKALIAFRKDIINNSKYATATTLSTGVTRYQLNKGSDVYIVLFNATSKVVNVDSIKGYKCTINENTGSYVFAQNEEEIKEIPAKSFMIVKRK